MRVGLTYDLRDEYLAMGYSEEDVAEFDRADTVAHIEGALRELGYETDRIGHIRSLMKRLAAGERWDIVFNFAEGLTGFARESQIPAVLDAFGIPYTFSDPMVLALSLHKGMTKRVLRDAHVPTADFAVVETEAQIAKIDLPLPLFAKPVAEGTGKGVTPRSKITSRDELAPVCRELLTRYKQPVLVETFLPGREFTVGVFGAGARSEAVPAVLEIILRGDAEKDVYSYVNKERCEELVEYRPVFDEMAERAKALAVQAWQALGCWDAGRVDLRADAQGELKVIELNPLAGLHPEHSDLPMCCTASKMTYVELIGRIMLEASKRVGLPPPPRMPERKAKRVRRKERDAFALAR